MSAKSITEQSIYTGDTIVYVGENGTSGGGSATTTNKHETIIYGGSGSNTNIGPFTAQTIVVQADTPQANYTAMYDFNGTWMGDLVPRQNAPSQVLVSKNGAGNKSFSKAWTNAPKWLQSMLNSTDSKISFSYNSQTNQVDVSVNGAAMETNSWAETMPPAVAGTVFPNSYTSQQDKYKAYGSIFTVGSRVTFSPTDLAYTKLVQGTFNNAVLAIYRVKSSEEPNKGVLICHGEFFSASTSRLISVNFTQSSVTLDPEYLYYAVLFSKDNGWRMLGSWRQGSMSNPNTTTDVPPYICPILDNITINSVSDIDNNCSELEWGGYEPTNVSQLWVFRKV